MVRRIGWPGWMSPSERGRCLGRISHSSMARGSFVSSVAGTTRRLSPVAVGGDEVRPAAASGESCHQRRPRGRDEAEIGERLPEDVAHLGANVIPDA